jgi:hypothetical protein
MHLNNDHDPADHNDHLERAEHYRALARELRAVAALLQSPDTKQQLNATAENYERIAESVIAMRRIDERLHETPQDGGRV